jgi:predicted secreted Zn-dependent protease
MVNLEDELAALVEQLKAGGTQAACEELRARIRSVRQAIEHRERNIAFVRDEFMDDE